MAEFHNNEGHMDTWIFDLFLFFHCVQFIDTSELKILEILLKIPASKHVKPVNVK